MRDTIERQFKGVENAAAKDDLVKTGPKNIMPLAGQDADAHGGGDASDERTQ